MANLSKGFLEEEKNLLFHRVRDGYPIVILLVLLGISIDHFVYPEHSNYFLKVRLCFSLILIIFLILHVSKVRFFTEKASSYFVVLSVNLLTCYFIYLTEGSSSTYYLALNTVLFGAVVLFPWNAVQMFSACSITLFFYLGTCWLYSNQFEIYDSLVLINNTFFLVLMCIVCVFASKFSTISRFKDYSLRYELDQKNKELEQMDKLKSQFFANISHELRTPLTLILSPIQDVLRKADSLSNEVHDTLLVVMQNATRLLKLVNELLDVMRLQEGAMTLHYQKIDLSTFIPGIVDSIRHLSTAKGLNMRVETQGQVLHIEADPNRLEKILLNLLTNAIKFTQPADTIVVGFCQDEDSVRIQVKDTGVGIAEHNLSKIFERFHQVDASSTRKYQGVGIGLSLTKDLVEKHGGELSVKSELGTGTCFTVQLPIKQTHSGVVDSNITTEIIQETEFSISEKNEPLCDEEPIAQAFKSADRFFVFDSCQVEDGVDQLLPEVGEGDHTILVVDDEPGMRRYLVSILKQKYRVLQAINGTQGLEVAQKKEPDLIVLDWMLPGMNGLQVCEKIRQNPQLENMKIILLTARSDEASKISALEAGANDFLTKPFITIEVEARITNQLKTLDLQADLMLQNCELDAAFKQLKQTEAQLVQSEKVNAIGTLSAGLLHEINNPLNFTLTALHFAQSSLPKNDSVLLETIADIKDGMTRIKDIVSDLRTFAYPENEARVETFTVECLVDSALRMLAHELKDQKLVREIEPNQQIHGSKIQLSHVLINFLSNSLKAIKKIKELREPCIKLSVYSNGDSISLRVWDNGSGIKKADKERIFDPFFTTADVGEGTGLGLSTCHTIIKNHHGQICVNSDEGHWTEIGFDLPLKNIEMSLFKSN